MTSLADTKQTSESAFARARTPLIALTVVIGALIIFGAAYLVAHKATPPPPAARIVDAKIAPGTPATTLRGEFDPKLAALIKPKPKPKPKPKKKPAPAVSSAPVESTPAPVQSEPTESYTPAPAPEHQSAAPKSSGTPSGGGVITIG